MSLRGGSCNLGSRLYGPYGCGVGVGAQALKVS